MNPKILLIKIYEPSVAEREGFIGQLMMDLMNLIRFHIPSPWIRTN